MCCAGLFPGGKSVNFLSMDPSTPGSQTSEFKLTGLLVIFACLVDLASLVLGGLQQGGATFPWLAGAISVVATIAGLVKALGYTRSRTMLKLADMQAPVAQAVHATVPVFKDLTELVKLLKEEKLAAAGSLQGGLQLGALVPAAGEGSPPPSR